MHIIKLNNIVAIPEQHMSTTSLIEETPKANTFVIESTYCNNKAALFPTKNDVYCTSEEVLSGLGRQIKP
jgi:hypothetical protein